MRAVSSRSLLHLGALALALLYSGCGVALPAAIGGLFATRDTSSSNSVLIFDEEAELLLARGAFDPGDSSEGKGATAVGMQLRVTATRETRLEVMRISFSGTGRDQDLTLVRLFEDVDGNGLLDEAVDSQVGSTTLVSGDDGTATFVALERTIAEGDSIDLLVVFDTPVGAPDDVTFQARIAAASDVEATTTLASGEVRAVRVLGAPLRGGIKRLAPRGSLRVLVGPGAPSSQVVFPAAQNVVMQQLELRNSSVEPVRISAMHFTTAGSGHDADDLARADLYEDVDNDGVLDTSVDLALALNVLPLGDDGPLNFTNLQQVLPASAVRRWIVVYTLSGSAADGASFRADLAIAADLTITGEASQQTILPDGLPLDGGTTLTVRRATLDLSLGAFNGTLTAIPSQTEVRALQLRLSTGPAETVVAQSLTLRGSGSADELTDLVAVRLFVDADADGSPTGETSLGGASTYDMDDGSVVLSGFQREIPPNTTETWLVTYDLGGGSAAGGNFVATLADPADLTASGRDSGLAVTPTAAGSLQGGAINVTGSLTLAPGPNPAPPQQPFANDPDVAALQFRLSAGIGEGINPTSIVLQAAGLGHDTDDILRAELYLDQNSDGGVDAGDLFLAAGSYDVDDGVVAFANPAGLIPGGIPPASDLDLVVGYDLSGQAVFGDTFTASVSPGGILASGVASGQPIGTGGVTVVGAALTAQRARLTVTAGADNPGDGDALNGQTDVPVAQLRLEAGPSEDVAVSSLTFNGSGTASDDVDVQAMRIYREGAGPLGVVDPSDVVLGSDQTFSADDGTVTVTGAPLFVQTAGTVEHLLAVYDVAPTANTPTTLALRFAGTADLLASGVSSGLSSQVTGVPVQGGTRTVRRGSLTVNLGAATPPAVDVFPNEQNLEMLQLRFEAGFPEAVRVDSLRVQAAGSADESVAVAALHLVHDLNGDGIATIGSDLFLDTSLIADDGQVTFMPAPGTFDVPGAQVRNLLLVYDLSGLSIPPGDLRLRLAGPVEVTATGLTSNQPIPPLGAPAEGNPVTLVLGNVNASLTPANPGPSTEIAAAVDVPMLQIRLDTGPVESVNVSSLTITHTGSGDPTTGLVDTRLFRDQNANGVLDADQLLATATFVGTQATFVIPGGLDIPAFSSDHLLVAHRFGLTVADGDTFAVSLGANGDLTVTGNASTLAATRSGAPLQGATKTIDLGELSVAAGAQNPAPRDIFRVESSIELLQATLTAGPAEAVRVTNLRLTPTGTGDPLTQVSRVRLYVERDPPDGLLNGDQIVADLPNFGPGAFLDIAPTMPGVEVPAGGSRSVLVVLDVAAPPGAAGDTFGGSFGLNTDFTAVGVTTGLPIAPTGLPPAIAVQHSVVEASLAVAVGSNPPVVANVGIDQSDVVALNLALDAGPAEPVAVTQMSFQATGTGTAQTGLTQVRLYRDDNTNGILDGDVLLGTGTFDALGRISFPVAPTTLEVPAGGRVELLVVIDLGGSAADGEIFAVQLDPVPDVLAAGVGSGLPVPATGALVAGPQLTAVDLTLQVSIGVPLPDLNVFDNEIGAGALHLRLQAGPSEGVRVTSLTLTGEAAATGDDTGVMVRLYRDDDGNGTLGAMDTLLGTQTYAMDGGTVVFPIPGGTLDLPPGGQVDLLAVYDLPATAADSEFYRAQLFAPGDLVAIGQAMGGAVTIVGGPFPLAGPALTVRESTLGLSEPNQVAAGNVFRNSVDVALLSLRATAGVIEDVRITSLTVRPGGASTGDHSLATVRLAQDLNANGTFEPATDPLLAGPLAGDNASLTFFSATGLIDVPAGNARDLLVVYDFVGAPPAGDLFDQSLAAADVVAVGLTSGAPVPVLGGPLTGGPQTVVQAALTAGAGADNPPTGTVFQNVPDLEVLQVRLDAGPAEAVRVTQVTITASGGGQDNTDLSRVELFRDDNVNGLLDGDTSLGSFTAYPLDDGARTFAIPPTFLDVPPAASLHLLVAYRFNTNATNGETFRARLANPALDLVAQGVDSGLPVTAGGGAVLGGLQTLVEGTLSATAGPANPAPGGSLRLQVALPVLQLRLAAGPAEGVRVTQLTITAAGSANDVTDLSNVELYRDVDSDGVVTGGDALLVQGTFALDNGTLVLPILPGTLDIPPGGSRDLLLAYDLNGAGSAGETFQAQVANPAAHVAATGSISMLPIAASGGAVQGGVQSLIEASLSVAAGPANPGPTVSAAGSTGVEALQLRFTAGPAEAVLLSQLVLTPSGTGNDAVDLSQVALYEDANQNGILDGDPFLVAGGYGADNTAAAFPLALTVPAGGVRDVLVVYDLAGGAPGGSTFRASLALPASQVTAQGAVTGLSVSASGAPVAGGLQSVLGAPAITASAGVVIAPGQVFPDQERAFLQLRLSEGSGLDGAILEGLTLTGSGSGDELTDLNFVNLYRDDPPQTGAVGPEDTLIGLSLYFVDDGTAVFGGLSELIPAGMARDFLLSYRMAGAAQVTPGEQYAASVGLGGLDLSAQSGGLPVVPLGLPVNGPTHTAAGPELDVQAGPANPVGAPPALNDARDLAVVQLTLTANLAGPVTVQSLTLQASGSGDDAAGIAAVTLYEDLDGDGAVGRDDREIRRQAAPYAADNGSFAFGALGESLAAGASSTWLVAYDLAGGNPAGDAFGVQVTGLSLTSGTVTGALPVAGATPTVEGSVIVSLGPANPPRALLSVPQPDALFLQLQVQADAAEAMSLSGLSITARGSAPDDTAFALLRVFLDDGDDVFQPAGADAPALATVAAFSADDASEALAFAPLLIPPGAAVSLWVAVDVAPGAPPGSAARFGVSQSTDVVVLGMTSGSTRVQGLALSGASFQLAPDGALFAPPVPQALGVAGPVADLAQADVDRDGNADLLALRGDGRVEVQLGDGAGALTFDGAYPVAPPAGPQRLAVGDLDRDGFLDLAIAYADRLSVLLNNGSGAFGGAPADFPEAGAAFADLLVMDYDLDGDLDLVALDRGPAMQVRGRRNDGTGGFTLTDALALPALPRRLRAGEFDGDCVVDLLLTDDGLNLRFLRGDGSFFVLADADPLVDPSAIAVGDLDRDGYADAIVVSPAADQLDGLASDAPNGATLSQVYGPDPSAGGLPFTTPADLLLGDWQGNGRLALAVTHAGLDGLIVREDTGSFAFGPAGASAYPAGLDPDRLASGDFDRDGDLDLLVGSSTGALGQVQLLLGDGQTQGGASTLGPPRRLTSSAFPRALALGDVDHDGDLDLVLCAEQCAVFLNDGAGELSEQQVFAVAGRAGAALARDLQRDGFPDLLVSVSAVSPARVQVFPGTAGGTFAAPTSFDLLGASQPGALDLADLDRDGRLDLAVAEGGTDSVQLLRGAGADLAAPQPADRYALPSAPADLLWADLNGDARPDLAVLCAGGTLELFPGAAGFALGAAASVPVAAGLGAPSAIAAGDPDADGDLDLVLAGSLGIEVLENAGGASFVSRGLLGGGAPFTDLALVDADRDGDLDLLATRTSPAAALLSFENSDGAFAFLAGVAQPTLDGAAPLGLRVGDLDRDGDADAACITAGRAAQLFRGE